MNACHLIGVIMVRHARISSLISHVFVFRDILDTGANKVSYCKHNIWVIIITQVWLNLYSVAMDYSGINQLHGVKQRGTLSSTAVRVLLSRGINVCDHMCIYRSGSCTW